MAHNPGVYQQLVGDERDVDERPTAAAFHPDPTDGVYRYGPRERRDVTYAWVYAAVASVVFILGCVASTTRGVVLREARGPKPAKARVALRRRTRPRGFRRLPKVPRRR